MGQTNVYGRIPLYPIDKVKLDKQTKHLIFSAKDVACFAVGPSCSEDDSWHNDLELDRELKNNFGIPFCTQTVWENIINRYV